MYSTKLDLVNLPKIQIYSNFSLSFEATKLGDFCYTRNMFQSKLSQVFEYIKQRCKTVIRISKSKAAFMHNLNEE